MGICIISIGYQFCKNIINIGIQIGTKEFQNPCIYFYFIFLFHRQKYYFPNSLILGSSFNEQTSSCPFFSATI